MCLLNELQVQISLPKVFIFPVKSPCVTQRSVSQKELKEYSVILMTSFYDINQQILRKKGTSKISVDSDFPFPSYA